MHTRVSLPIICTDCYSDGRFINLALTVLHANTQVHTEILYRGVLLLWISVGQGPTALAVGAGGGYLDIFSFVYRFSFLSPSLWETARYRLKYCLKGPFSAKQLTNQRKSC